MYMQTVVCRGQAFQMYSTQQATGDVAIKKDVLNSEATSDDDCDVNRRLVRSTAWTFPDKRRLGRQ